MERTYIAIDDLAMTTSRNGAIAVPKILDARMRLLFLALPV
jgi:hypothetical protein